MTATPTHDAAQATFTGDASCAIWQCAATSADRKSPRPTRTTCVEMQIFGKMPDGRCITIEIDMNAGVFDVACKFTDKGALRPCHQRLIFAGKQLEHDRTLQRRWMAA